MCQIVVIVETVQKWWGWCSDESDGWYHVDRVEMAADEAKTDVDDVVLDIGPTTLLTADNQHAKINARPRNKRAPTAYLMRVRPHDVDAGDDADRDLDDKVSYTCLWIRCNFRTSCIIDSWMLSNWLLTDSRILGLHYRSEKVTRANMIAIA